MTNQRRPIAQVLVSDPIGPAVKYDGFAHYEIADEALRQGRCTTNYIAPSAGGAASGGGAVSAAMAVNHGELRCVVARPMLDTVQAVGLGHFDRQGGTWLALHDHGIGNEVKLYQSDGTPNRSAQIVSRFTLPRNPVFCVSLYRAEPGPGYDWQGEPPCTEVRFGIAATEEWRLTFPYCGPMSVLHNRGAGWRKVTGTERSVHVPTLEGFARGQRMLLWVAVWDGRLVLSTDGFAEDVWAYAHPGEPVSIPQGKIAVSHNAGQMMASLLPIKMATAVLDSQGIDASYETQQSEGELILDCRHLPVSAFDGTPLAAVATTDTTGERYDLTGSQRSWRATIPPWLHRETGIGVDPDTGASVDFETYVSPELYSIQLGQFAEFSEAEAPVWHDLSSSVAGVAAKHTGDPATGEYRAILDATSEAVASLKPWRRARVSLGWCGPDLEPAYEGGGAGHVADATYLLGPGGAGHMEARLAEQLTRLSDEKCDGRAPVFDGWPVARVFEWVLGRCGIRPEERVIEDTGAMLSLGNPRQPLWLPEAGQAWLEFLGRAAQSDHAAGLFCDLEGRIVKACRYCRQPRTASDVLGHDGTASGSCPSEAEWHLLTHTTSASASDGSVDVLQLVVPGAGSAPVAGANHVVVLGQTLDGAPLRATATDTASIYDPGALGYVGWRRMEVLSPKGCTSQDEVDRLAGERLRVSAPSARVLTARAPLTPGMRIGQVVQLDGVDSIGLDGQRYRISSVAHHVRRSGDEPATTTISGQWIADS